MDAQSFSAIISDPYVTVIDVRSSQKYDDGHVVTSIDISVESDQPYEQITKLDKAKISTLYCRSGVRSTLAAD